MNSFFKVLVLSITLASACKNSGNLPVSDTPAHISFSKTAYDFGIIPAGFEGKCEFEFENTSEVPLLINDVKTSCGCTSPEWPEKPVLPGKKGVIKVKYTSGSKGVFVKSITIYSNAKNSPFNLFIRGEIQAGK